MTTKAPTGFALMSPERRRELGSKGGRIAQASGHARRMTPEEARAAAKKGGAAKGRPIMPIVREVCGPRETRSLAHRALEGRGSWVE